MHYIQMGYATSRRHGVTTYRAQACDGVRGCKGYNGRRLGIGDTREEAEREALAYVAQSYRALGLVPPTDIVNHGKQHGALVDACLFWKD